MKKLWLGLSLAVIGSLMVAGLSGCYVRGEDDGYRKDRDHHEDNRGHDEHEHDRDRGEEHGDQDRRY